MEEKDKQITSENKSKEQQTPTKSQLAENISKETLIQLLKDKSKVIKSLKTKLSKIETRYKKIHKDNRNMKKDRKNFEELFDLIFNQEEMIYQKTEIGECKLDELTLKWNNLMKQKDQKTKIEIQKLFQKTVYLENDLKVQEKEIREQIKKSQDQQVQSLNLTINNLQTQNQSLQLEVLELTNLIKDKETEIQSFKPKLSELSVLKAQIALKELEDKMQQHSQQDFSHKLEQSNHMNEILELQNLLEEALTEKEILSKQLGLKNEKSLLEFEQNQKIQTKEVSQQTNLSFFQLKPQKIKKINKNNDFEEFDIKTTTLQGQGEQQMQNKQIQIKKQQKQGQLNKKDMVKELKIEPKLNQQYLKNIIIRYFHYLARGNYSEAEVLEHVIFNILKVTDKEKQKLIEDRENYTLWSKTKYVLTGGYFYEENQENTM